MGVQGCMYVGGRNMVRSIQLEYPELTAKEWVLLGFIRSLIKDSEEDDEGNTYEFIGADGRKYHQTSHRFLSVSLAAYGLGNIRTLQRSLNAIIEQKPPLLQKAYKNMDGYKKLVGYRFTNKARELFYTGETISYKDMLKMVDDEDGNNTIQDNELEENDPIGTSNDPEASNSFMFPDWFDEQWERIQTKFPKALQYKYRSEIPNKYATTFVIGVLALCKGTFYSTVGKYIKDKSAIIPEGLTPEKIVDGILAMPDYDYVKTPAQALIFQSGKYDAGGKCYSPLLKYWEKNGVAGSSTRSQATLPATKPVTKPVTKSSGKSVRSNVQYTEEDYKSNRKVMYTYDYIKSYLPNGMVGEMVYGDVSDYWLDKNKFVKKYDNRITNFCLDMQEAYADAGKKRPSMSNVLDTIVGMAQFRAKEGTQKWEDVFWDIIDQMPIYQDCKLWRWFIERFEHDHGEGQSNCDMYKGNTARKQAQEADAQYRAIEQTAREIIGED